MRFQKMLTYDFFFVETKKKSVLWGDDVGISGFLCIFANRRNCAMMEKLMQYVWQHRLYDVADMATVDGRRVRVIDPGRLN